MKPRHNRFRTPLLTGVLATSIIAVATMANAATFTWDASGGGSLFDGSGVWTPTGGTNWFDGANFVAWGNTTNDEAVFGVNNGAAGQVVLSATVNANKLTFATTASGIYDIAAAGGASVALGGVAPMIVADAAGGISAPLSGSAGMIKSGTGILTLGGKSSYTGGTTVNAGTLALNYNSGGDGTLQGSLTVNPGAVVALKLSNALGYSGNNWVRTITLNEGTLRTDVSGADNGWGTTINMFKGTLSSGVAGGRFSMGSASLFNVTGANAQSTISADLTVRDTISFNVSRGSTASDLTVTGAMLEAGANRGFIKGGNGILTLSGDNTFAGASASSTLNGGTLRLDYSVNDSSKLANNGALVFGGRSAILELAGGSHQEVVSGTTLNANSATTITRSSGSAVIHLGAITRNSGATLSLAEAGISTTSTLNNAGGILGTWAMIGNDWAVNSTNGVNGPITAFTAYTDYTRLSSGTKVIADDATSNIRIIDGTGTAGNLSLGAATTSVNSMKLTASGGATVIAMGTNTLSLGVSGGILTDAGGAALMIGTTPGQGILSAGGNVANTAGEVFLNQLGGSSVTINASIVNNGTGAVSLSKIGSGDLTLTGANTYTGTTLIGQGTATYAAGSSFNPTAVANLRVGGSDGKAVLNLDSSGIFKFGHTRIGGDDGNSHTGKGAINQTAGTVSVSSSYLGLGVGTGPGGALTDTYGSYVLSGGSSVFNHAGIRLGDGGLGVFTQTGGTHTSSNHFVIGASEGSDSAGTGVATFTGGAATITNGGTRFILADRQLSTGTLNIGTLAGGSAVVENGGTQEVTMLGNGNARGASVNLNTGTLIVGGPLKRNTGNNNAANTSTVNLNGGTLKVKGGTSLIDANPLMKVNVFNGGLKVDTQANTTTIGATLLATTGSGIYPAGGALNLPAPDGAGYIGAPLVTVTTSGAGTGAGAIANVVNGQVTGVTLTCPGQGYLAGDTVSFAFAGGGFSTAASTFAYNLQPADLATNGSGGLTKLGSGKLTVSGTEMFGGLLSVEGKLAAGNLSLGSGGLKIVNFAPGGSGPPLEATTALTTTAATVPVEITGTFTLGTWPIIYYPVGTSVGGNGGTVLQLNTGALPRGVVASVMDNPGNASVDLDVTEFNPLTWKGTTNGNWDINTTTNWTIGAVAEKYQQGDIVLFDDSVGANTTSVVLNTSVSPASVAFENDTVNYTLSGTGAITGVCGLTKSNNGTLLIRNANTYTGTTTVDGGMLQLGDGTLNGSVAGPLVNNATVVFNPAGTSADFPGVMSGAGTYQKIGSGTQVFVGATNASTGTFEINEGIYQLGNGVVTGASGPSCQYQIAAGAIMHLERPTAVGPFWNNISGVGTLALNSAQPVNGSANWGEIDFPATFAGTLRVEKGRVAPAAGGNTSLGATSKIQILPGAQFLAVNSVDPYAAPIEIAGDGWGEAGYPGGLRLAGGQVATWAGDVTLTADSGIKVQSNANFTITGSITGSHRCDMFLGEPGGAPAILNIAPTALVQNSYASTRIDGQPNCSVVAGNERAFSLGPLEMVNATLKLNGYSFSFASLSGAGGQIGNYGASPSVLTVGDASDTSYAGTTIDGDAASLSLAKTGTGKLTLSGFCLHGGDTTVNAGTLELAETGRLRFVIGASSGGSNKLTGSGSALIDGDFVIDTSAASALTAGTWLIENVASLTGAYGSTFQVLDPDGSPWTDTGGNKWTRIAGGKVWTFDETTGTLTLGGSGYETWADSWPGLTDKTPGGDPDRDGISNLMEYVLGGDPRISSTGFLPKQTIGGGNLVISYKRSEESKTDITLTGQWSTGLGGWADIPAVMVNDNGGNPDDMTVTIPLTNAVDGKLFGRIKATLP